MPYSEHSSEAELIAGCQRNDRLAQKFLYHRYYEAMYRFCLTYSRDREEAMSILNSGFLKVFQSMDKLRGERALAAWIKKIMFRTAIDHIRSQGTYRKVIRFEEREDGQSLNTALKRLEAQDVLDIIQQLPAAHRTVFSLYYLEGYKHSEIAELLAISVSASKWHLMKAKQAFVAWVQAHCPEIMDLYGA
ncbi:MAG: RNA polymerase sigma factor [Bacteroidota bacterium]